MHFFRTVAVAALSLALVAPSVLGAKLEPRGKSSTAMPVQYKGDTEEFTYAAGLQQETYCADSKVGMKIGDAELLWQKGDGNNVQRALVYHSKKLGIVLAMEGTNLTSIWSDLHDAEAIQVDPDHRFRKFLPKGTKLLFGFQDAYLHVVDSSLAEIKKAMKKYNESRVTVTGHSLGAGMGIIATAYLENVIPGGLHRSILFGLPRTGNDVFADYIDKKMSNRFHWIANGKDWVPHVPPRFLGYQHPGNMLWINPANSTFWLYYPGQENKHGPNSIVPEPNFNDHQGIYFGTQIGASNGHCPATVGKDGPTTYGTPSHFNNKAKASPSAGQAEASKSFYDQFRSKSTGKKSSHSSSHSSSRSSSHSSSHSSDN